jgi:hypothetical protein
MFHGVTDPELIYGLIAVFIVVIGAAAYATRRIVRGEGLRKRFQSDYALAFDGQDSRQMTEANPADRDARIANLEIRALTATERARFVVDPHGAVNEADELVSSLLRTRGYPVGGFNRRTDEIPADYSRIMEFYSSANANVAVAREETATERLQTAMLQYGHIFDELAQVETPAEERSAA